MTLSVGPEWPASERAPAFTIGHSSQSTSAQAAAAQLVVEEMLTCRSVRPGARKAVTFAKSSSVMAMARRMRSRSLAVLRLRSGPMIGAAEIEALAVRAPGQGFGELEIHAVAEAVGRDVAGGVVDGDALGIQLGQGFAQGGDEARRRCSTSG